MPMTTDTTTRNRLIVAAILTGLVLLYWQSPCSISEGSCNVRDFDSATNLVLRPITQLYPNLF